MLFIDSSGASPWQRSLVSKPVSPGKASTHGQGS